MERTLFDQAEASAKVGQRIRTRVEFSGVPQGATGQVVKADASGAGYTLAIEWDLAERRAKPLVDWFTKIEYERLLEEI